MLKILRDVGSCQHIRISEEVHLEGKQARMGGKRGSLRDSLLTLELLEHHSGPLQHKKPSCSPSLECV
ncbi:MAG: hypothetical protein HY574_02460 [candidate division NC10 bacterium]|nr:hypothetical protein [candidate division NC10 bacterium]